MSGSAVLQATLELFHRRHYSVVAAVCEDALAVDPDDVELRLLRARALAAVGRDPEAAAELRACVVRAPDCGAAFRLLGQIAVRANKPAAACTFLQRALSIDADDREAGDLFRALQQLASPGGAAAPAGSVDRDIDTGCATGAVPTELSTDAHTAEVPPESARLQEIHLPAHERTRDEGDFTIAEPPDVDAPAPWEARDALDSTHLPTTPVAAVPARGSARVNDDPQVTCLERPAPSRAPAQAALQRVAVGTCSEGNHGPLFGEYLVEIGCLSPAQLDAALDYHRSSGTRVGAAAVALGFTSAPKIEWAALAFHSQRRRR